MIKTAVIFCGGYGKRLGNITKKIPKPMVMVAGKPFLEHLLLQLKENNIKNIFLLVGYKKDKIINYFKNGKKLDLNIRYSHNIAKYETGYRLNYIKNKIKDDFIILYSDNYCPFNIYKNYSFFLKENKLITLSVVKKKNGNVSFKNSKNIKYSIKRSKKNHYVEIGYMIVKNKFLKLLTNKNVKLSKYFVKEKISNKINAIEIKNKYLSISDPKRLKETRKYFKKKNIILIDRDGVINAKSKLSRYVTKVSEIKMNNKLISVLKKYPNFKYICITNQAGIATKELKKSNLTKINNFIKKYLKNNNINLKEFFVSPHHFKSNNFLRKPNPGNFLKAAKKYNIILDKTFYIGDDPRDVVASYNANTKCVYMGDKKNLSNLKKIILKNTLLENLKKSLYLKDKSNY
jgi:D-glycero-D-manno-heptose 1,7-bisphosphate phosphatase